MKLRLKGFALPAILIASLIMLAMLLVSVSSSVATRISLVSQTYNQLAKDAADAGVAFAKACLNQNNNIPLWSDSSPLTPYTDCSGTPISNLSSACSSSATVDARCLVALNGGNLAQVLIVGGGGGGSGGGGSGGGVVSTQVLLTVKNYSITVGTAGAGGKASSAGGVGTVGGDSTFNSITAKGGGPGGQNNIAAPGAVCGGVTCGSGGGGGNAATTITTGAVGTSGQGFSGGNAGTITTPYPSAGGGGAGSVGQDSLYLTATTANSGAGGSGIASDIIGSTVYYGGGGGGGAWVTTGVAGAAGAGGGGAGGAFAANGSAGGTNLGGGGGGAGGSGGTTYTGGAGGTGVVIISVPTGSITVQTCSGCCTSSTSGTNTVYKFTCTYASFNVTAVQEVGSVVTSSFSVGAPTLSDGVATDIKALGYTRLVRTSDSTVWRVFTQSSRLTVTY